MLTQNHITEVRKVLIGCRGLSHRLVLCVCVCVCVCVCALGDARDRKTCPVSLTSDQYRAETGREARDY